MKGLTAKEEEIMGFFWEKGPLFVKEMLAFYEEPKPHFNTLSTIVRGLEDKGFLSHHTYGKLYSIMIEDCAEPGKEIDELLKIFSSFISDKISDFQTDVYYQNPSYLECSYEAGYLLD